MGGWKHIDVMQNDIGSIWIPCEKDKSGGVMIMQEQWKEQITQLQKMLMIQTVLYFSRRRVSTESNIPGIFGVQMEFVSSEL